MKRRVFFGLLAIVMVATLLASAQEQPLQHVADLADVLTDQQEAQLNEQLQAIYDDLGFDSLIITANDYQSMAGDRYAAEYYEKLRSPQQYPNGVALIFNPHSGPNGEIWEAARGTGKSMLGAQGDDALFDVVRPYARDRDYFGMFQAYGEYLRTSVTPSTPAEVAGKYGVYGLVAGFVVALISALTMKAKLKTARRQTAADRYAMCDTLNVTQAHDLYLYETVVRRKIEKPKSSSGGGSSFTSSSGTSYSSRGGKL